MRRRNKLQISVTTYGPSTLSTAVRVCVSASPLPSPSALTNKKKGGAERMYDVNKWLRKLLLVQRRHSLPASTLLTPLLFLGMQASKQGQ